MPKASSFNPLQVFSPIQLVFCLVLFFLPWIELSCKLPAEAIKEDKAEMEAFRKQTGVDPTGPIGMVSQSGLQIATGDSSEASDAKKIMEAMKKEAGGAGGAIKFDKDKSSDKHDGAPLLYLYLVAVIAGIVFGFLPWGSPARKFVVLGCCLGAFAVVGLQAAIGFPMDKEVNKKKDEMKKMGGMFGGGGDPQAKGKEPEIGVRWKFPLYLTMLLLLGAAGTSLLGGAAAPPKRSKKKRRYDDDDDDEEPLTLDDEEEPEEKPKPRARDRGRSSRDDEDEREERRDRGRREERGGKEDKGRKGRKDKGDEETDPNNPFAGLG